VQRCIESCISENKIKSKKPKKNDNGEEMENYLLVEAGEYYVELTDRAGSNDSL